MKLATLPLVVLLAMVSWASGWTTSGQWTYIVENGGATITESTAYGSVSIPRQLGGYAVRKLGDGMGSGVFFEKRAFLIFVYIPDSVTSIGAGAFSDCELMERVTIPDSVTSIGAAAFRGCDELTSVSIPNGVRSIENSTFSGCRGLTGVNIPDSVTSIGVKAFDGCISLTSMNIPDSVTSIGERAFSRCTGLSSVSIGNGVKSIGDGAFLNGGRLTSVSIGNSVTSIGSAAFSGCTGLTSVTIPDSVTSIGDGAFEGCYGLTGIAVGSANTKYSSIGGVLFNKTASTLLTYPVAKQSSSYAIPNSVTSIGSAAFSGCTGLTSVTIPDSVTSIGDGAFSDCSGLSSVLFLGNAPTGSAWLNTLWSSAEIFYLGGTSGWQPDYNGRSTKLFAPVALSPSFAPASGFQFSWSGASSIPMNVQRASALAGPWTVVSTENATGNFTDLNPPEAKAFYRVVLP